MQRFFNVFAVASAVCLLLIMLVALSLLAGELSEGRFGWNAETGAWLQAFFTAGALTVAIWVPWRVHRETLEREDSLRETLAINQLQTEVGSYVTALIQVVRIAEAAAQSVRILESYGVDRAWPEVEAHIARLKEADEPKAHESLSKLRLPSAAAAILDPLKTRPFATAMAAVPYCPRQAEAVQRVLSALYSPSAPAPDGELTPQEKAQLNRSTTELARESAELARTAYDYYLQVAEDLAEFLRNIGFASPAMELQIDALRDSPVWKRERGYDIS